MPVPLVPCTPNTVQGELRAADPAIEVHEDVLYNPVQDHLWHDDPMWGTYGPSGHLIDAAAYYRGPGKVTVGQSPWVDRSAFPAVDAPDETYIYGGTLIEHFGHFLLSSLSRFWPFADDALRASLGPHRILCHGVFGPDHWWGFDYMRATLLALGIPHGRLVRFPHPVRVRRLIVPRPSFEEHSFVHAAYPRLTRHVGARLGPAAPSGSGPAYLSRVAYPRITQGFDNEAELEAVLAALGVEVIRPEVLPLADQSAVFARRRVVLGTISSAFHAAVLAPRAGTMILLSPTHIPGPNFALLDRAFGLDAHYLHPPCTLLGMGEGGRMGSRFRLDDPAGTARELLALVQTTLTK